MRKGCWYFKSGFKTLVTNTEVTATTVLINETHFRLKWKAKLIYDLQFWLIWFDPFYSFTVKLQLEILTIGTMETKNLGTFSWNVNINWFLGVSENKIRKILHWPDLLTDSFAHKMQEIGLCFVFAVLNKLTYRWKIFRSSVGWEWVIFNFLPMILGSQIFFSKKKYFYQVPGNRFVYKISVIWEVCQLVKTKKMKLMILINQIKNLKFTFIREKLKLWDFFLFSRSLLDVFTIRPSRNPKRARSVKKCQNLHIPHYGRIFLWVVSKKVKSSERGPRC